MRLGDRESRRVLHHAAGIARRELDVGDDGVVRVLGIEFAKEPPCDRFILSGSAALVDYETSDARAGASGGEQEQDLKFIRHGRFRSILSR